ncbi:MAG: DUF72 domain-containing protein [Anaerolineae bacterium]|nr:DUF72 domain-containing protein [Anaerolineae bacterium]
MTDWHLGTIGFGYKQWLGTFFPLGLPPSQFLAHYAHYFNSAELDTTFYGIPKAMTVRKWAQAVPSGFTLCPKTPRDISHAPFLPDTLPQMSAFVDRMRLLSTSLGPILIQFPPTFTFDYLDDLTDFLARLPTTVRYAVEFRDASWRRGRVLELLSRLNVAWVSADYIHLPPEIHLTTDFLYLRFIGTHGQFATKDHILLDRRDRLQNWLDLIEPHLPQLGDVYGFFNNDYSGHSPGTCNQFKRLIGLPTDYPDIPVQGSLF